MVAARLLNKGFSMTLHGSDLLLHGAYLDLKLESCTFCMTIPEYNRRYILALPHGGCCERNRSAHGGADF